jgi:hypothetical protein
MTLMGEHGVVSLMVDRLIARAAVLDVGEAADLYRAHGARLLLDGSSAERSALQDAARIARRAGRLAAYEHARHAAARAWRSNLPLEQGPWLFVGATVANAAGALVLEDVLDAKTFKFLFGPWQQAIGRLVAVGPGMVRSEVPIGARDRATPGLRRSLTESGGGGWDHHS